MLLYRVVSFDRWLQVVSFDRWLQVVSLDRWLQVVSLDRWWQVIYIYIGLIRQVADLIREVIHIILFCSER